MTATATARDRLVDTALRLFNAAGYRATGIDRVVADAGVARMTLYNQFGSKDALIDAVLARRAETLGAFLEARTAARATAPADRLIARFDALGDWFRGEGPDDLPFRGCMFLNAAAEFADPETPARRAARSVKLGARAWFRREAAAAGVEDADSLAAELALLAEGAIATALVLDDPGAAAVARRAAVALVHGRHAALDD